MSDQTDREYRSHGSLQTCGFETALEAVVELDRPEMDVEELESHKTASGSCSSRTHLRVSSRLPHARRRDGDSKVGLREAAVATASCFLTHTALS